MRIVTAMIGFVIFISSQALGQHTRHGAHLHGVAELTVALEEDAIEMMFTAPAASVVGFESEAASSEQLKAVEDARLVLRDPFRLVTFVGKKCDLIQAVVDLTAISSSQKDEYDDHDEGHHDHDEGHEAHDEDHHDHDEGHDDHDSADAEESHSDIFAKYEFDCSSDGQLKKLEFGPDELLFGLDKVNVMWVSESGQGAAEVTADQLVVELN